MASTSYEVTYKRRNPEAVRLTVQQQHRLADVFLLRNESDAMTLVKVCRYNNMILERL